MVVAGGGGIDVGTCNILIINEDKSIDYIGLSNLIEFYLIDGIYLVLFFNNIDYPLKDITIFGMEIIYGYNR